MREIEFRGKRIDTGEWVYGFYAEDGDGKYIISDMDSSQEQRGEWFKIEPSTVGQYTGFEDKNGVGIFEGDQVASTRLDLYGEVMIQRGAWINSYRYDAGYDLVSDIHGTCTVIGNIHDK